jgi:hypothetical protein
VIRTVRLVLKLHRFDVFALGTALVVLGVSTAYVALRMHGLTGELERCTDPVTCTALQDEHDRLYSITTPLLLLGVVLPIFAGVLFGVPIVAREVERGTASLPWSMSRSRRGWLLRRIAILGLTLVALTLVPAMAMDILTGAVAPDIDVQHSFFQPDTRVLIVGARALAAFGIGVLAGSLLGRALPALLLALAGTSAALVGLHLLDDSWLNAESVLLADDFNAQTQAYVTSIGFELPDGRIVDWQTAYATLGDPNRYPEEAYPGRYIGVPAALAPEKHARQAAVILLAGVACVAAATVVVERRRPY